MAEFTPEKITRLVQEYIRETLVNDEKCRSISGPTSGGTTTLPGNTILESSDMKAEEAQSMLHSVNRWLRNQDHSLMSTVTEKLLKAEGADVDPDSDSYKVLGRELLKAFQGILQVRAKRSIGDYSMTDEEMIPVLKQPQGITTTPPGITTEATKSSQAALFSEVRESYLVEVEKAESWTAKTKAENLSIFELFTRVMGDIPVDQIDRKLLSEYKAMLMKLPPNLNKMADYKDKTIAEVIASKPKKTLTVNTINKYIRRLSGFFNYSVQNGFMLNNPASGLQIKSQKRADQEREAYNQDDLKKLFECKEFRNDDRKTYTFWAPLIALYTGCRLEEVCQLHLEDIRQEGGVWVFDINDKEEKRLKNMASERLVPIHPHLISIGLIQHAEALRKKEAKRLFPELHQRRDGYGQTVSKWYQRYKQRCGVAQAKNFHSFRHTFITHLKHKKVDQVMLHEIDGHTIDSQTMGRYGKRYTPDILLRDAIEKIDYGLELPRVDTSDTRANE
jgi:integrase